MYVEGTALIDLATNSCAKPQQPSTVLVVPSAPASGTSCGHSPATTGFLGAIGREVPVGPAR